MPLEGDALAHPKDVQLARGERRYKRKVASAATWQRIADAKRGPCRVCTDPASNGQMFGLIEFHHLVTRKDCGDDCEDNIVPVCPGCHADITMREPFACRALVESLTDAEREYAIRKGGAHYFERAYGVRS